MAARKAPAQRVTIKRTKVANTSWSWVEKGTTAGGSCQMCKKKITQYEIYLERRVRSGYYGNGSTAIQIHKECLEYVLSIAPKTLEEAQDEFARIKDAMLRGAENII